MPIENAGEGTNINQKKLYVWRLGQFLESQGTRMSFSELARHLNRNGFRNEEGEPFSETETRGVAGLVNFTYAWVCNILNVKEGANEPGCVAVSFVTEDDKFAWMKGEKSDSGDVGTPD